METKLPPPQEINPTQLTPPAPMPQPVIPTNTPTVSEPPVQKKLHIKATDGPKPLKYFFSVLFLTMLFVLVILIASFLKEYFQG